MQPIINDKNNAGVMLRLEGDLTIERAAELLEACRQALAAGSRIAVTFGEIGTVDLSCLQLLCSAHRTAVAKGKQFFFAEERPDTLSAVGEQAGFIRKRKCQMNPEAQDCLWLRGRCNE